MAMLAPQAIHTQNDNIAQLNFRNQFFPFGLEKKEAYLSSTFSLTCYFCEMILLTLTLCFLWKCYN